MLFAKMRFQEYLMKLICLYFILFEDLAQVRPKIGASPAVSTSPPWETGAPSAKSSRSPTLHDMKKGNHHVERN
jgi:hypothetical protein